MAVPPPDYVPPPWVEWLRAKVWVISFVFGLVTITALYPLTRYVPEMPEVLFQLPPDWGDLVDHREEPFTAASMKGRVWVAGFVFTRCPSSCPAVMRAMKTLHDRFDRNDIDVDVIVFTVDPEHDTPEVLRDYAASVDAVGPRWRFVSGPLAEIYALVGEGFKLGVGDRKALDGGLFDIAHSTKLALVDETGAVRGYYSTETSENLDEVYERADRVWMETRRRPPLHERLGWRD